MSHHDGNPRGAGDDAPEEHAQRGVAVDVTDRIAAARQRPERGAYHGDVSQYRYSAPFQFDYPAAYLRYRFRVFPVFHGRCHEVIKDDFFMEAAMYPGNDIGYAARAKTEFPLNRDVEHDKIISVKRLFYKGEFHLNRS